MSVRSFENIGKTNERTRTLLLARYTIVVKYKVKGQKGEIGNIINPRSALLPLPKKVCLS